MHEWEHPRHFTLGNEVDGDYVTEVPEYAVDDSSVSYTHLTLQ